MAEGVVFNIQRFSLHDGTGIRTLVFLKGCPLRCIWCANPEGQRGSMEIRYDQTKCIGCSACITSCPKRAVTHGPGTGFTIDRASCDGCGTCAKVCPSCAKSPWGEHKSVDEIVEMVRRDACFYRHSGGGVTIGGGEVLFQPAFTGELLRRCREDRLNTAIETSGYGQWRWLEHIARYCDTIFYDVKAIDRQQHMHMTGVGNELILANLTALDQLLGSGSIGHTPRLVLRVPVIPEQNADRGSMEAIGAFISSQLRHFAGVELLPFHNLCEPKYAQLGRPYAFHGRESATSEQVEPWQKVLTDMGVPCTIMAW